MTRKHFKAFAAIIRRHADYLSNNGPSSTGFDDGYFTGYQYGIEVIADDLVDYFEGQNELFDRARFLTACGLESSV